MTPNKTNVLYANHTTNELKKRLPNHKTFQFQVQSVKVDQAQYSDGNIGKGYIETAVKPADPKYAGVDARFYFKDENFVQPDKELQILLELMAEYVDSKGKTNWNLMDIQNATITAEHIESAAGNHYLRVQAINKMPKID